MNSRNFFAELKRRNVLRAGAIYAAAVWALAQGIAQLTPVVSAPDWVARWFLVAAAIGFPFWVAFAWFYEFTPTGLRRESDIAPGDSIAHSTGRKLDFWIIGILTLAVVLLLTDRFVARSESASSAIPEKSIAVLPFENLSSDRNQEYFSDGISEELLNLLTKVPQLEVTARTSSFAFKGKGLGVPEIARKLHVAHILEGSVQKAGSAVRITVHLVDAATDRQRWSQTWDRQLDDIFKIQDEIAADVMKELKVSLLGAAPTARPTDPHAYAFYLQAVQLGRQLTAEAFKKSDALCRKVLEIDPRYAPAWERLASNLLNEPAVQLLSSQEGYARARQAAEKALAIDPGYAPAHADLGWIAMLADNNLAGAAKHFERALTLDPTDPEVLSTASAFLQNLGRVDEGVALQQGVVRRDPVNVTALYNLGDAQLFAGRYDDAIASFRTILSLSPGEGGAHANIASALLLKGDSSAALAETEQEKSEAWRMFGLPMAYCALGRKADSDKALAALIGKYEKDAPYNIAYIYAFCGNADKAFAWLDKAIEYHDPGLGEIVPNNLFDNIHSDPRWLSFLRKIGKAPEQLAKIQFKIILPP